MFDIERTNQFKKDFKLIVKRKYDIRKIETLFELLITGKKLPNKYSEHPLKGNYIGALDCHIEPDWIVIFKRNKTKKLITLIRTGTHSDIFKQK